MRNAAAIQPIVSVLAAMAAVLAAVRRAWSAPPAVGPAQWAEMHRTLAREQSDNFGPFRWANAPYGRGIAELCALDGVFQIWIEKSAQVGASEAVRCFLGWKADRDPDPVMLVLPNEELGKRIISERIIPLFRDTPVLHGTETGTARDTQLSFIKRANGLVLYLAHSGSASSMASHPCQAVILDEVDKFLDFAGREADPVSLALHRLKSYRDRAKLIGLSTPVNADGQIHTRRTDCAIQLRYHVPCGACHKFQELSWDQVVYAKANEGETPAQHAERVQALGLAHFHCKHCRVEWSDVQRIAAIRHGYWSTPETCARLGELAAGVTPGGIVRAEWPAGRNVGLHIWDGYALWVTAAQLAADFIQSHTGLDRLQDWRNSRLGLPMEVQQTHVREHAVREPARVVGKINELPAWCGKLLATIDVQEDRFYYVVRAWGAGFQSRLIRHGILQRYDELEDLLLRQAFPFEGGVQAPRLCDLIGIDSGGQTTTHAVYQWALKWSTRVKALKGTGDAAGDSRRKMVMPIRQSRVTYKPREMKVQPYEVWLNLLDSDYFKDQLAYLIQATRPVVQGDGELLERPLWEVAGPVDDDYARQMASEHKVLVGRRKREWRWVKVSTGAQNHYWDCEYYNRALADMARVELLEYRRPAAIRPAERPRGARAPIRRQY